MKKTSNHNELTAKQMTEMMNLLISMIHSLGHRIDIDMKAIQLYEKTVQPKDKIDLKKRSHMICKLILEIENLKKALENHDIRNV